VVDAVFVKVRLNITAQKEKQVISFRGSLKTGINRRKAAQANGDHAKFFGHGKAPEFRKLCIDQALLQAG
jgi:hypothetical protein